MKYLIPRYWITRWQRYQDRILMFPTFSGSNVEKLSRQYAFLCHIKTSDSWQVPFDWLTPDEKRFKLALRRGANPFTE